MNKIIIFIIFIFFNSIYALSSLSVLVGGIYLIIKIDFNEYLFIIIGTGLIMTGISIMGFCSYKRPRLLIIYMILISLIFILEIVVVFFLKFYTGVNNFVKNKISDIVTVNEEEKEKIMNLALITLICAAGCCLISFLCGLCYYRKLKERERKYKEEQLKNDEVLKGLDHTNLNPNESS